MQDEAKFIATKKKIDTTDEVKFVESTFNGIPRPGGRGTGTRNYVVVIGISASVAGFVRAIEKEFKKTRFHPNVDGRGVTFSKHKAVVRHFIHALFLND